MVHIEAVDTFLVDAPTIRPHVLAVATMSTQTMCFVRLRCSDGIIGLGEGTTIGGLSYGDESPDGIKLTIDRHITPLLLRQGADCPAEAMNRVCKRVIGNHFAKCAVETALLDAQGKRTGLPLSELLGGRVRGELPVLWTLASGNTIKDIEEAEHMLAAARHNTFKLKIGKREIRDDVMHVTAIKRALGDRASVRVDVNQAWSESGARQGIAALADAGVDLVEQPISRNNRKGMARLAANSPIPIMADEALRGPEDAFALAADHAADVFAIKIQQSGGLFAARNVAAIASAAGIGIYGGTMLEAGVATIASAHLFSTLSTLEFGTELFGPLLLTEELLMEPLRYANYHLTVPMGPGLGIEFDEKSIARLRRDRAAQPYISLAPRSVGDR